MRQSIIFILYLLCTFTARSQSVLRRSRQEVFIMLILPLHLSIPLLRQDTSLSISVTTVVMAPVG